jgi:hypothetical protein
MCIDISLLFYIFVIKHLKTEIKLNSITGSVRTAKQTLHLGYKNQSVNAA